MGQIDTITEVNGKWCALSKSKGWLPLQYVMTLDMAEKFFSQRIKKDNQDFDAWAIRGKIRFERNQLDRALSDLNQSIKLNPNLPATFVNRANVLRAQRKYREALANLDQAIKMHQKYGDAYENRGMVLAEMGQFADAIKNYDKAISLRNDNPWSYINRGAAKNNIGDYMGAKTDYLQSLRMNRNISDAYIGLSVIYLSENKLEKAFKFANEAVKKNQKNGMAYNQRGWTNYRLDKLTDAIHDFDLAVRFAPSLSIAYSNRGFCYKDQKKYNLAIKDFNRAIRLNPESAIAFLNRGEAYLIKKKYKNAKSDFEKAFKLSPTLADAANGLGWLLATCPKDQFRDASTAIEFAQKACELSKWKNWSYMDTLAAAFAEKGDFEKAIEMESKALEMAPEEEKSQCQQRLALYKGKKPFRSEFGKEASEKERLIPLKTSIIGQFWVDSYDCGILSTVVGVQVGQNTVKAPTRFSNDIVIIDETEPCPYLPDETARMPLRMPVGKISLREADERLADGHRRTGEFVYKTNCPNCKACQPVRIDCSSYAFSKNQNRVLRRNDSIFRTEIGPLVADEKRVELFNRHRRLRGLAKRDHDIDLEEYIWGFVRSCFDSFELTYWRGDHLACVAICDRGQTSLSAVYTFFDPMIQKEGTGDLFDPETN